MDDGFGMHAMPDGWMPLSVGQRALWFEQLANPASNAYNLGACLRFRRCLEAAVLDRALVRLADRHALMRARFGLDGALPSWRADANPPACAVLASVPLRQAAAFDRISEWASRPYDLTSEPPFRLALIEIEGGGCLLGIACHHIVADLHSLILLARELAVAYAGAEFSGTAAPYADFCHWQHEMLAGARGRDDARHWSARLANLPADVSLGILESGTGVDAACALRESFRLRSDVGAALARLAAECGTTPFVIFLSVLQILLALRCGRSNIVVGAPTSGRNQLEFANTVGYFVNLLPMVLDVGREESFASILSRNESRVREALRHGQYPYANIVQEYRRTGAGRSAPLVQATITFQKTGAGLADSLAKLALQSEGGGLTLDGEVGEVMPLPALRPQFPLGLALAAVGEDYEGNLEFDPGRISPATARGFLSDWLALVAACVTCPQASIAELSKKAGLPDEHRIDSLTDAIERAFELHADRPALADSASTWSYRELNTRSAALASQLQALGLGTGDRIAVIGDGGPDTICAIVAVLRSGAAFVPIDGEVGTDRAAAMLKAARVSALIPCGSAARAWSGADGMTVVSTEAAEAAPLRHVSPQPLDPAWLMFTSGTTGTAKIAVVPQEAALAHARGIARRFELRPDDRVLQFASLSFDEHAEEIFPTLLRGACIVSHPRVRKEEPETLLRILHQAAVSVLHLPTSYWHLWMDEAAQAPLPETLRLVNVGGEQASLARLRTWSARAPRGVRWFNTYGLTEAAVTSLAYELNRMHDDLQSWTRVPVGTPLEAMSALVVDDSGTPLGAGEVGELLLGGPGVGLGYFERPDLAQSRFFTTDGVRWIRSGDLACADRRGNITLLGRRDGSLKLRGERIDPAEIEAMLVRHAAIAECVIAVDSDSTRDDALELHLAVRAGQALGEAQVRDHWRKQLPSLPAPAGIYFHASIPRTEGRKPDFAKLRAASTAVAHVALAPEASDELSMAISEIFARLLRQPSIERDADFFAMGGHSLLAMRLVAALRRELAVECSIGEFLARPTIDGVAALCSSRGSARRKLTSESSARIYPLSHAQRRALMLSSAADEEAARALLVLRIDGPLDPTRLDAAWHRLLRQHGLLTAQIRAAGVNECIDVGHYPRLQRIEWAGVAPAPRRGIASVARSTYLRLADRSAPINAALLRVGDGEHILVVEARHTAIDGGCIPVLLRDMASAYASDVEPSPGQSRDYGLYVAAESEWLASAAPVPARVHWTHLLQDAVATQLPHSTGMASKDFATHRLAVSLGTTLQRDVLALARRSQCSPFAVLLSAFLVLLQRYGGGDDILIGVPLSLRDLFDAPEVVGPTLNPLPFRAILQPAESFDGLLSRVRELLGKSVAHGALPYEEIASQAPVLRGAPLPIQFVAQHGAACSSADVGVAFSVLEEREGHSPVDLLAGIRVDDRIRIEFEYRIATLTDARAAALLRSFRILIKELVRNPQRSIGSARVLPQEHIARALAIRESARTMQPWGLLHEALTRFAIERPDHAVLIHGPDRLTYEELERLSNRHAAKLAAAGVAIGDHVAIASRKGVAEIVAVLAVLKAGAAYVPIACDLPRERAVWLMQRIGARVATGEIDLADWMVHVDAVAVNVDLADRAPASPPPRAFDPDTPAYILFTSGSTGEPKGVEVSHRAALTTIGEVVRRFELGADDVYYGVSALGFDLSVFDIFGALASGGSLVVPPATAHADPYAWADEIRRQGVTVWNSVPAAFDMLLAAAPQGSLRTLRRLLLSGDWIGLDLPERAKAACPAARFLAFGGATEAAIWSNFHEVDGLDPAWSSIPYGRALDGQAMFVSDPHGWPVPIGVVGEICIGGGALAKGYWNEPAQTADKFVLHASTGMRIYRTGDLGRYLADGAIEFLGRSDRQIKVRGHRVEIGEVETAMARLNGVRRILVAPLTSAGTFGSERLIAYVQPHEDCVVEPADLRRHAESLLPDYMRPARYILLPIVPLTPNSKVDWKALAELAHNPDAAAEPATEELSASERRIAALWRELAGGALPARQDDFFASGGHSLLAMQLLVRVGREFDCEPPLSQWLAEPTLAHLARIVDRSESAAATIATKRTDSVSGLRGRVQLADDIVCSPPREYGSGAILITGASGLIGLRLIAGYLLNSSRDLICLVRDRGEGEPERQIGKFLAEQGLSPADWRTRLSLVQGDLALPRFGLSDSAFQALATATGSVFHVGAKVNLIAGYESLEAVNVRGTHEVIRLAAMAGAPLHHVSSVGVLPYGAGRVVRETDSIDVPGELFTGYCQSKWVAEQCVRLAAKRGLRTAIYRPGLTIASEAAAHERDLLAALFSLSGIVGAFPALDMPVDFVTADYVASAMRCIASQPGAIGGTFHLTHPQPLPFGSLMAELAHAGTSIERMPFDTWKQHLLRALPRIEDRHAASIGALIAAREADDLTPARVDCSHACALLEGKDLHCAPISSILTQWLARDSLKTAWPRAGGSG
jgi:amino acid adenylation domain-containing protein/thioester reductase-like protein